MNAAREQQSHVDESRPQRSEEGAHSVGSDTSIAGGDATRTLPPQPADAVTLPPPAPDAATLPPRPQQPGVGVEGLSPTFGNYTLLSEIARGGMGVVYKARQERANRVVALKLIQSGRFASPDDTLRFRTEAEAAAHLTHPNIVPIYDVGEIDGQHFFSMAFIEGENLRRRIADGPLPNREAAQIVAIIADAMAYAHAKGVIHRDLKPENVLLDREGQPHITDFGLAKRLETDTHLTSTGQILGTPSYMSPEQAAGETEKVGMPADIYSLGAILYCLLTGRPPFQAPSVLDTMIQVMGREPVSPREINPLVDRDLETLCLKCLEKQPAQRLPTAEALSDELGRYLRGEPIASRPLGRMARLWRWARRNRMVAGLAAAVLISLLAGVAVSTYFAFVAGARAVQAEKGRRIAVRTLQSVIFNVQRKLKPFPEAREVRRTLIKESLQDLDEVSKEISSDDAVDHGTAAALVDLARLFEEIGADGENTARAAAERYYLRAIELYRKLRRQVPDDRVILRDYATALVELSGFYKYANCSPQTATLLEEALPLRRQLTTAEPNNREDALALIGTLIEMGEAEFLAGGLSRASQLLEEAVSMRRSLDRVQPPNNAERAQLGTALNRLGETYAELGNLVAARTTLDENLAIVQELQTRQPKVAERGMAVSEACERLGDLFLKTGELSAAKAMYERMRDETEKALKLDSGNRLHEIDYVICFDKLYDAAMRMHDLPAAERACKKSIELRTKLTTADPSDQRTAKFLDEDLARLQAIRERIKASGQKNK